LFVLEFISAFGYMYMDRPGPREAWFAMQASVFTSWQATTAREKKPFAT
jgi:hypothetical protein